MKQELFTRLLTQLKFCDIKDIDLKQLIERVGRDQLQRTRIRKKKQIEKAAKG
jgi:hypothetical protein